MVPDSAMSPILHSPLTGKTYKLPPRTVSTIEALSHEYGTKGKVLAAIAYMLSKPDPREGLTPAPAPPPHKIIYDEGETTKTLLRKHEQEVRALTNTTASRASDGGARVWRQATFSTPYE
jgi:hypothetical protein